MFRNTWRKNSTEFRQVRITGILTGQFLFDIIFLLSKEMGGYTETKLLHGREEVFHIMCHLKLLKKNIVMLKMCTDHTDL